MKYAFPIWTISKVSSEHMIMWQRQVQTQNEGNLPLSGKKDFQDHKVSSLSTTLLLCI